MSALVPITVTAKNEERFIGRTLDSLHAAMAFAEQRLPVHFNLAVVLDDCTDGTADVVRSRGVQAILSSGGKVEAQRRGLRPGPFQVFSDADIELEPAVLANLVETMLSSPEVEIAFPGKQPLPPRRRTPLALALHAYNRHRGFSSAQHWFSGKLFAIRAWRIPTRAELTSRAPERPDDAFFNLAQGIRADDIYLSRATLQAHGPAALRETAGTVWFRAPETWEGMYRYYRRLQMELARTDALCPETCDVHRRFGTRTPDRLASATAVDRAAYGLFRAALLGCQVRYRLERSYYQRFSSTLCDGWVPVEETKCP